MPDMPTSAKLIARSVAEQVHQLHPEEITAELLPVIQQRLTASIAHYLVIDEEERKKAALCQLLLLRIDAGDYGNPKTEPIKSIRKDLSDCFFQNLLDSCSLEEIYEALEIAWATKGKKNV